jgi:hypothetical protein
MAHGTPRLSLFLAAGLLYCGGCALLPHPVPIPADLRSHGDTYAVSGGMSVFQHKMKFGPFRVEHAYASAISGDSTIPRLWNGRTTRDTYKQTSSFDFKSPTGAQYHGECRRDQRTLSQLDSSALDADSEGRRVLESEDWFRCTLKRPGGRTLFLELDQGSHGSAKGAQAEILISAVDDDGVAQTMQSGGAYGFELYNDQGVRALVDVSPERSISLTNEPSAAERDELAVVCAALLIMDEMYD